MAQGRHLSLAGTSVHRFADVSAVRRLPREPKHQMATESTLSNPARRASLFWTKITRYCRNPPFLFATCGLSSRDFSGACGESGVHRSGSRRASRAFDLREVAESTAVSGRPERRKALGVRHEKNYNRSSERRDIPWTVSISLRLCVDGRAHTCRHSNIIVEEITLLEGLSMVILRMSLQNSI
jgi:hypothetical protein